MTTNEREVATENSWREWSRYVLKQLEALQVQHEKVADQLEDMRTELAVLKIKSGFFGAISGIATTVIILAIEYIRRKP